MLKKLIQPEHRQTDDGILICLTTLLVASNDETVKSALGLMRMSWPNLSHSCGNVLKKLRKIMRNLRIVNQFNIHSSVHRYYIRRVQPTRCNVSQITYFCKTLAWPG